VRWWAAPAASYLIGAAAAAVARDIASAIQNESAQAQELPNSAHCCSQTRKYNPTCALRAVAPWRAEAERNGLIVPRNEAVACIFVSLLEADH
jgi:hypothetical protein